MSVHPSLSVSCCSASHTCMHTHEHTHTHILSLSSPSFPLFFSHRLHQILTYCTLSFCVHSFVSSCCCCCFFFIPLFLLSQAFCLRRVWRRHVRQPVYVYTYAYMCEQMFARGALTCPSLIASIGMWDKLKITKELLHRGVRALTHTHAHTRAHTQRITNVTAISSSSSNRTVPLFFDLMDYSLHDNLL